MNNINAIDNLNTQKSSPNFEKKREVAVITAKTPTDRIELASRSNGYLGKLFDKVHGFMNIGQSRKSLLKQAKKSDGSIIDKKINRYYDQNKNETEIGIDLITGLGAAGAFKLTKKAMTYSHAYAHSKYEKWILLASAGVSAISGMIFKPILKGINSIGTPKNERKKERTILKDIGSGFIDGAAAPIAYAHKLGVLAAVGINSASRYTFNKHKDKQNSFSNHLADGWLIKIPALAIAGFSVFKFHKKIGNIESAIKKAQDNVKNIEPFNAKLPLTELFDLAKTNVTDKITQNELLEAAHKGFFGRFYNKITSPIRKYVPQILKPIEFLPKPAFRTLVKSKELLKEKEMIGVMKELEQYNIFYPKMIQSMPSNIESLASVFTGSDKGISEMLENLGKKSGGRWYERIAKNFVKDRSKYLLENGLKTINDFLNKYKSKCPASRDVKEAQKYISETFGDRFKVLGKEPLGVGTIAETFLAKDSKTDKEVVIKVVKKWASVEKLNSDKKKMLEVLQRAKSKMSRDDYNYQVKLVDELYKAWSKELDMKLEADAAQTLGKYAVNYNTVAPVAVKNNIFVMEKAKGVQFDEFVKWLEDNKKTITEDEAHTLLRQYFQVFFEQLLSVPKEGQKVLHADPHAGNIFIDINNKKKPFTFIDTGNVMRFTPEEAIQNVTSHLDYIIGNTKNIARRLVKGAVLPKDMTEEQAADMLSKHLSKTFFSGKNKPFGGLSDPFSTINNESMEFMKKNKVILNSRNTNLVKAEITYLANLASMGGIIKRIDPNSVVDENAQKEGAKLMLKQIGESIKNGIINNKRVTIKEVQSRLKYIDENLEQFFTALYSYIPPDAF